MSTCRQGELGKAILDTGRAGYGIRARNDPGARHDGIHGSGPRTKAVRLARFSLLGLMILFVFSTRAFGQLPNSGQTGVDACCSPVSTTNVAQWSLLAGYANISLSAQTSPDSSPVVEVDVTQTAGISVQNQLVAPFDLRSYDSFAFWIRASATRSPNFVYLVDTNGARHWYALYLQASQGWVQQEYWITSYVNQDVGFNLSQVAAVMFNQAGELVGDKIWIGATEFEHNSVNHAEAAGNWLFDVPGDIGDSIKAVTDAAVGSFSVEATGNASSWGQMDIATSQPVTGATWNWTQKTYLTFYYKDSYSNVSHYAAIYDKNGNYREWVFQNNSPGQWIKITVALADNGYFAYASPGPPDLSNLTSFELGIFGGVGNSQYTFQVDELSAY
jgi:hypothetical protein